MRPRVSQLLSFLLLCVPSEGHEDFFGPTSREPPYDGPGYRGRVDTAVPLDFPSRGVRLLGWLPLHAFDEDAELANDCWGYTTPAGREYALLGLSTGTGFVDVTTPAEPRVVAFHEGPSSFWRDIKVFQEYAYVVSEGGGGIQVFDLSAIDDDVVRLSGAVGTEGNDQTHNLAIDPDSGFLYRTAGDKGTTGLRIYDLSDAAAPAFVASWNERYVHDAQVVTYFDGPYQGREIAFCFSEVNDDGGNPGVDILDVTDKSQIVPLSFLRYSDARFSHQGWLSEDRRYLYVADERDERSLGRPTTTRIIDVSALERPVEVGTFTNGVPATDHNLYVRDHFIYCANYRSGLRVFDGTAPLEPVEVAYFDTYLEDDSPALNGLFSTYPFFASGIVIGSDVEKGLFVWWVGEPAVAFDYAGGRAALLPRQGGAFSVTINARGEAGLLPGSAKLSYTSGAQEPVETDLIPLGGSEFQVAFPAFPCGLSSVSYCISVESANHIVWRDPSEPTQFYRLDIGAVDCNENGADDSCDIATGTSEDCDGNGVPDACDLASRPHVDCNADGVLDGCEGPVGPTADCNENGVPDGCDLLSGNFPDCNQNGVPDACDLDGGDADDRNGNGLPDECEPPLVPFRRGDVNANLQFELADAVLITRLLFIGVSIGCQAAADSDDSGETEITDAIHLLSYLFSGTPPPPSPFVACGFDRTPDLLGCVSFGGCESR